MPPTVSVDGTLEITNDGRVWFHSKQTGTSLLRIQGLPMGLLRHISPDRPGVQIDIRIEDMREGKRNTTINLPHD